MDEPKLSPEWIAFIEIGKIAIPVLLGFIIWLCQSLVQRAWNDYEKRRDVYEEIVREIDALFTSGERSGRVAYLRAVRRARLVASDDVVRVANALSNAIREGQSSDVTESAYRSLMLAMRKDLDQRRFFPSKKTALTVDDFPIEGPGA